MIFLPPDGEEPNKPGDHSDDKGKAQKGFEVEGRHHSGEDPGEERKAGNQDELHDADG